RDGPQQVHHVDHELGGLVVVAAPQHCGVERRPVTDAASQLLGEVVAEEGLDGEDECPLDLVADLADQLVAHRVLPSGPPWKPMICSASAISSRTASTQLPGWSACSPSWGS